jgi:hypothetical protein
LTIRAQLIIKGLIGDVFGRRCSDGRRGRRGRVLMYHVYRATGAKAKGYSPQKEKMLIHRSTFRLTIRLGCPCKVKK